MSIRMRLTLWYSGILAVILLGLGATVYLLMHTGLYNDMRKNVRLQANEVYSFISPRIVPSRNGIGLTLGLPPLNSFRTGMALQIIDKSGNVVEQSNSLDQQIPVTKDMMDRIAHSEGIYEVVEFAGSSLLVYNRPILYYDELIAVLRVATVKDATDTYLRTLKYTLLLIGTLIVLLAASVGWFLSRKALQPIEQVILAANAIEKSADLDKRIDYAGPKDEVGRLTDTINGMLTRIQAMYSELDEAYRAQRRFVSDASHELRTPLTTIRGNVELLEKIWAASNETRDDHTRTLALSEGNAELSREAMHDIAGEAERMSRLVNDLLSLARADAGFTMHHEWIVIRPLVEEVVRRAQFLPRTVEWITGDMDVLDGVMVRGNKDYLQQLLFIFVENGFKYTEQGHVKLDACVVDKQVGLRISDTGIGMDKDEVPHIFERFYRADVSRGKKAGTGLGLSIAQWIIDQHGGSIEVTTRKEVGTTFIVWLPIADPPPVELSTDE